MRLKVIGINIFLSTCFIYIALLSISFIEFNFLSRQGIERKYTNNLIKKKLLAVNNGFMPLFNPVSILNDIRSSKIYPIGSLPFTPTFYCDEGYGFLTYTTDRFGLRNDDSKWQKIFSNLNIFVIGDSFVHGACVPEDSTITAHLEKSSKRNVLNLGTSNNGPYEYIAIIKSIIKPIIDKSTKKNIVIKVFYDNDNQTKSFKKETLLKNVKSIVRWNSKYEIYPEKYYTQNFSNLIKDNYPLTSQEIQSEIKKNKVSFLGIFKLYSIRKRVGLADLSLREKSSDLASISLSKSPSYQSIQSLADVCKDKCTPYVVYIPNSNYWRPNSKANQYKLEIKKISEDLKIKFIDGENVIDKNDRNYYAPEGAHLSLEGYKKIAELMYRDIFNNF